MILARLWKIFQATIATILEILKNKNCVKGNPYEALPRNFDFGGPERWMAESYDKSLCESNLCSLLAL